MSGYATKVDPLDQKQTKCPDWEPCQRKCQAGDRCWRVDNSWPKPWAGATWEDIAERRPNAYFCPNCDSTYLSGEPHERVCMNCGHEIEAIQ